MSAPAHAQPPQTDITERELRDAYRRAGLWRRGWTFVRAIRADAVSVTLLAAARAARRRIEREHKPTQRQPQLI